MDVLVMPADAHDPDGPEVVRKTASLPEERRRLLREAEVLAAAAERGVPGLATVITPPSPGEAEPSLVTAAAAGPSLAVAAPLPVLEVAGVAAEVARLLACLHDTGLVHGAVEPSHVVLDGAGSAILVGLGDGGRVGAPSPDPAAGPLDPAEDVAGWGALVTHLLDWSATTEEEPLVALRRALVTRRGRRAGRRRTEVRPGQAERRVLAALADQAQDPDPARRPAARSLAAAIAHRVPGAHVPGAAATAPAAAPATGLLDRLSHYVSTAHAPAVSDPEPADPGLDQVPGHGAAATDPTPAEAGLDQVPGEESRRGRHRPPRTGTATPTGAGRRADGSFRRREARTSAGADGGSAGPAPATTPATGPGWLGAAASPRGWSGQRRLIVAGLAGAALLWVVTTSARLRPAEPGRSTIVARPARCGPVTPPAADVDGDGCEEPVQWSDGVLQAGSVRFALGAPGDAWAVGDWDCDGRRTPALLHGGVLTVFDDWPGPGAELQGRQVAEGTGATGLTVVGTGTGCDRPSLSRAGRPSLLVDPRRAP